VGLVGDADIIKNKGSPPVMPEDERFLTLQACKFVDEIIRDAPYDLSPEWVDSLVRDHAIDYVVHGDDPCITADGKDAYAYAKSIGRRVGVGVGVQAGASAPRAPSAGTASSSAPRASRRRTSSAACSS